MFNSLLNQDWQLLLTQELNMPEIKQLQQFLAHELTKGKDILPPQPKWFNALNSTPFEKVKVVILGQDPYPTPGHAHGLCFSVLPEVSSLPKSLININKELLTDLNIDNHHTGYLQPWAEQGILLINAVLTVEAGLANSHQNKGWEVLTDAIIQKLSEQKEHLVFILWGKQAQKKEKIIDNAKHFIIKSPHPSPLSAYRGFFGSHPFSKTNEYLKLNNKKPIHWHL